MDLSKIIDVAYKAMANRRSHSMREKGFIFYHGQRTAKLTLTIREMLGGNDGGPSNDVMYTAALFHDVAKGIEPHAKHGSMLIKSLLSDFCSKSEIEEISGIIELHNKRKNNSDIPRHVRIVQDADTIDHTGTLEIWMKFVYSAHNGENVFDALDFWKSDSYKNELKRLRAGLSFDVSRTLFEERIKFVESFIDRFNLEAKGRVPGQK